MLLDSNRRIKNEEKHNFKTGVSTCIEKGMKLYFNIKVTQYN